MTVSVQVKVFLTLAFMYDKLHVQNYITGSTGHTAKINSICHCFDLIKLCSFR